MAKRTCSVDGCERPHRCRGWCNMHYSRWRRHGDPLVVQPSQIPTTPESFWLRTKPDGACVVWTGRTNELGYGEVSWNSKTVLTHRLAFFLRMGRWPDGILRHLCNNPPCVLHVVEGTSSENTLDSVAAGTHNMARRTHCKWGHPFDEANTNISRGRRECRTCKAEWNRRQYEKQKGKSQDQHRG